MATILDVKIMFTPKGVYDEKDNFMNDWTL